MSDNVKPSLSIAGWISAPVPKLDELIADFYCAEYSQSYLYYGHVASIQHIVQVTNNNPRATCNMINDVLKKYLERYFNEASVEATWVNEGSGDNKASIRLSIGVSDKYGTVYSFHDIVGFMDSKAISILNANNGT